MLEDRDRLTVSIGESRVHSPPERLALLQAAHGQVVDIVLDDLVTQGESDLQERVGDAKVVMVRSQEIDEVGEAGKLAAAHNYFPIITEHLRRAVAKLSLAGITRFVISSDHGFLIPRSRSWPDLARGRLALQPRYGDTLDELLLRQEEDNDHRQHRDQRCGHEIGPAHVIRAPEEVEPKRDSILGLIV